MKQKDRKMAESSENICLIQGTEGEIWTDSSFAVRDMSNSQRYPLNLFLITDKRHILGFF